MPSTGQRLKEAREYIGFAFEEVCDFCHLSATWMAEIELGKVEPNPAQLARLAKLYQRPATWFTGLYVDPNPEGERFITIMAKIGSSLEWDDIKELDKFAEFLRLRKAATAKPKE